MSRLSKLRGIAAAMAFALGMSAQAKAQEDGADIGYLAEVLAEEMAKRGAPKEGLEAHARKELEMRAKLEKKAVESGLAAKPKTVALKTIAAQEALVGAFMEEMKDSLSVDEATLRQDYEIAYPQRSEARIEAALFESKAQALVARKKIAAGKSTIRDEAKKGSNEQLRESEGDLGFMPLDAFPPEAAAALEKAKVGETLGSPLETPYGHMVAKIIERREARAMTFEEAKPKLEEGRKNLLMKAKLREILEGD